MTTQELKEYIGRVLGNSIRCLLPSYWWKRLFGLVVDKVDEVEGRVLEVPELITSSLAEFAEKYPDVESRTFYLSDSAEMIEKNAALLAKVIEEYESGIIQQVYLATYFNGETDKLIITSPQLIVANDIRFVNVATPFFTVFKDVIINEDGTVRVEDAKYGAGVDTSEFATITQLNGLTDEVEGLKGSKQDEIDDLAEIRSGAALGATALQSYTEKYTGTYSKPSDGIPKADLASDVQTSLEKADTALQKHQPLKTINGESIVGDGNIEIKANVDTSTLATKEMVTSLSNEVVANEEVTAAALNDLNERVNAIRENVSGETATKVELQTAVESLTNTILENEEVTAAALNELNARLKSISRQLTSLMSNN